MDELFEALTLIQTGKIRDFAVILFGSDYWRGLIDWIRDVMLAEGKVSPDDLELLFITDSPAEAVAAIVAAQRGDMQEESPESPEKHAAE